MSCHVFPSVRTPFSFCQQREKLRDVVNAEHTKVSTFLQSCHSKNGLFSFLSR